MPVFKSPIQEFRCCVATLRPAERVERSCTVYTHGTQRDGTPQLVVERPDDTVNVSVVDLGESPVEAGVHRRTFRLLIAVTGNAIAGPHRSALILKAGHEERILPVVWTIASVYTVEPERLNFGEVPRGAAPLEGTVLLSRADKSALQITKIDNCCDAIRVRGVASGVPWERRLSIELDPSKHEGFLARELLVHVEGTSVPQIAIPICAYVK